MKLAERLGISLPLLKWQEPRAVAELNWHRGGWPKCRKFLFNFWKLALVIGVPVLIATKVWLPEGFLPALLGLLALCSFLPTVLCLQLWTEAKGGKIFGIHQIGVSEGSGQATTLYKWDSIASYHFVDHLDLPNIRVLQIKVQRKREFERQLTFNSNENSETEIRQLIEAHLGE